jgi:hypothetical protein
LQELCSTPVVARRDKVAARRRRRTPPVICLARESRQS